MSTFLPLSVTLRDCEAAGPSQTFIVVLGGTVYTTYSPFSFQLFHTAKRRRHCDLLFRAINSASRIQQKLLSLLAGSIHGTIFHSVAAQHNAFDESFYIIFRQSRPAFLILFQSHQTLLFCARLFQPLDISQLPHIHPVRLIMNQ